MAWSDEKRACVKVIEGTPLLRATCITCLPLTTRVSTPNARPSSDGWAPVTNSKGNSGAGGDHVGGMFVPLLTKS